MCFPECQALSCLNFFLVWSLLSFIYYFSEPSLGSPQIGLGHSCYSSVYCSKIWKFQIDYSRKMFCIHFSLHASHLRPIVRTLKLILGGLTKNLKLGEVCFFVCDQQEESHFHMLPSSFSYLWCSGCLVASIFFVILGCNFVLTRKDVVCTIFVLTLGNTFFFLDFIY